MLVQEVLAVHNVSGHKFQLPQLSKMTLVPQQRGSRYEKSTWLVARVY